MFGINKKEKFSGNFNVSVLHTWEYATIDIVRLKSEAVINSIEAIRPRVLDERRSVISPVCYKVVDRRSTVFGVMKTFYCNRTERSEIAFIHVFSKLRRRGAGTAMIDYMKSQSDSIFVAVQEDMTECLKFLSGRGIMAKKVLRLEFGEKDGVLLEYASPEKVGIRSP